MCSCKGMIQARFSSGEKLPLRRKIRHHIAQYRESALLIPLKFNIHNSSIDRWHTYLLLNLFPKGTRIK